MKSAVLGIIMMAAVASTLAQESWRLVYPYQSYTIAPNPANPRTLYLGSWAHLIYRSDDGGDSWVALEAGSLSSDNAMSSIVVSSLDTNVVVVGGFLVAGIKRSTDRGATWNNVLIDSNFTKMNFVSEAIIEDRASPGVFFAARGTVNNGIWRSTDNGATWDSIASVPREFTTQLCTISQRTDSTNVFFIGAKGGVILRSNDQCRTWSRMRVNNSFGLRGDAEIPKIVFSPRYPNIGYAVATVTSPDSLGNNGGMLKTTDGGFSWQRIGFVDTSFWSVEVRQRPDADDDVFIGGYRISNRPTVLVGDGLVYRSTTSGNDWSRYEDIPWGENEVGDTLRNAWVLRWVPSSKKLYMAALTGLFVLDEPTSVTESSIVRSHSNLRCTMRGNTIVVNDMAPSDVLPEWALYSTSGALVRHGTSSSVEGAEISTDGLPSGVYLLTWGNTRYFRTASVAIVR